MNVAYIDELVGTKRHGGSAAATVQLAKRIQEKGVDTKVFSFSKGMKTVIPDVLKLSPNIRELLVFPYTGRKTIREIEKEYTIIHFSSTTTTAWCRPRVPTVVTCHCLFSRQTHLCQQLPYLYKIVFNTVSSSFFEYVEKKSFANCDQIIAPKRAVRDFLVNQLQVPEEKVSIIHQGVDTHFFTPGTESENYVLFVGRGSITKGFDTLLKASNNINAEIVAVTPFMQHQPKTHQITVLEKTDTPNLKRLYQRAQAFVMPSLSETGPLVTLEAMACGLPIVCTPEGGGDFVKDAQNGFIIPPRDPGALSEKVNFILDNPDIQQKFSEESRRKAESFSLHNTVEKTMKVYKKLVE